MLLCLAEGHLLNQIKGVYKRVYMCAHRNPIALFFICLLSFNNTAIIVVVKKQLP